MQADDVRRVVLALPEATEEPHFDMTSYRVRGKIFATLPAEGDRLHIFVDEDDTRAAVAEHPDVFAELWWGQRLSGVRVALAGADPAAVGELLEEAWRRRAAKRLLVQHDADRAAGVAAPEA